MLVGLGGPRIRASGGGLFGPPGGSWALLGGPWAPRSIFERFWVPFGPPFGVQNRPWNAPRATSRPILPSRRVPGRVPEGLWEVILGTFLRLGWRERKKRHQKCQKTQFFKAFVACVFLSLPCVFCSPRRSPAHQHNLKNWLKPLVFVVESAYAPFARAARPSFKSNESRTT